MRACGIPSLPQGKYVRGLDTEAKETPQKEGVSDRGSKPRSDPQESSPISHTIEGS